MATSSREIIAAAVLLLICSSSAIAMRSFDVGGISISIPPPHGFIEVTPKMTAAWQVFQTLITTNRALATYIPTTEQSSALTGGKINLDRNISVQVSRRLEERVLTSEKFEQMRKGVETMIVFHQSDPIESKAAEQTSARLAKLIGSDPHLSQTRNITLPFHLNEANEFSYSEISSEQITMPDGSVRQTQVTQTATVIFVHGKILMCYVTGAANDLSWTRAVAKEWATSIISAN